MTTLRTAAASAFGIGAVLLFALHCSQPDARREPTVLFFVRHAETDPADASDSDPPLSPLGRARALALARVLTGTRVTHLYSSTTRRTEQTLAALAAQTGLVVKRIPPLDQVAWTDALEDLPPGSVAVVAGHGNTIPELVARLGGSITDASGSASAGPDLESDAYDHLFVLVRSRDRHAATRTLDLRYGLGARD